MTQKHQLIRNKCTLNYSACAYTRKYTVLGTCGMINSSVIHHGSMLKRITYGRTAPADRQSASYKITSSNLSHIYIKTYRVWTLLWSGPDGYVIRTVSRWSGLMKFSLVNIMRREATIPSLILDTNIYLLLVKAHINGEHPLSTIL